MISIQQTDVFANWLQRLKDRQARAKIMAKLAQIREGNLGDVKSLSGGVYEARLFYGPGYRLYFGWHGEALILLLCGGNKSSQQRDIKRAHDLWEQLQ